MEPVIQSRRLFLLSATGLLTALSVADLLPSRFAGLAADTDNMDFFLEKIRKQYDLPALASCVISHGEILEPHAVGYRKNGSSVKVTVNDQFHLGSDTKAMTATLIGMLVEEGKLDWSRRLDQLFPELARTMHHGFSATTIDQLLAARGGLPEKVEPPGMTARKLQLLKGSPREQRYTYIKMMLAQAPDYTPGTKFVYSNCGYALLGVIAEQLTDTEWETLMLQRIFQPLGMSTAGFGAMGTKGALDEPLQHAYINKKIIPVKPGNKFSDNPAAIAPGGLVHCSVGDWAKFVRIHLLEGKGEGTHLLKPDTLQHLHTPLFGGDYMAGWVSLPRKWAHGRALTHTGSNGMNYAVVWMAPAVEFAVLVCTNFGNLDAAGKACDHVCGEQVRKFVSD